jgi:hypothetical protein
MAIITSAGLSTPDTVPLFNKNGSVVTSKKISETDWLLSGDLAEGDSGGFPEAPQEGDFEWQYEFEGYGETIQPVGFNDEVEDLDISVPLDTSGSIVFRPYGGGVAIPEPNTPWLRVRMAGVFAGLEYVITYGNESQESGVIVGGGFNFQTGDKGGFISLEIQRPSTSEPQIGWISFNWTAPF